MPFLIIGIILIVIIAIFASNICIVPQAQAYIIERLGAYHKTLHTGFHIKKTAPQMRMPSQWSISCWMICAVQPE